MDMLNSVSNSINYNISFGFHAFKKITNDPSMINKVLSIVPDIFLAYDLYYGRAIEMRPVAETIKGTIHLLSFAETFNDIKYWINPLSKESIDQDILESSLESSLRQATHCEKKQLAKDIVQEILSNKAFNTKNEVQEAIKTRLQIVIDIVYPAHNAINAECIANSVTIQKRSRPITQQLSMICFTLVDLGGNAICLQKWGFLNMAKLASTIGSQSTAFSFVIKMGAETILSNLVIAGFLLNSGKASQEVIMGAWKYYHAEDSQREQISIKLQGAILVLASSGSSLINLTVPLLFTLNPLAIVSLAIVTKGIGVVCFISNLKFE